MTIPLVNAIVFWAFGDAKRFMARANGEEPDRSQLSLVQLGAAGAYAGFVNAFVVTPMELVKIQLQGQAADAAGSMTGSGRYYAGPLDWARSVYRSGARATAYFQGMIPTIMREIPAYAGQFLLYEVRHPQQRLRSQLSAPITVVCCGCPAQGYMQMMIKKRKEERDAYLEQLNHAAAFATAPVLPTPAIIPSGEITLRDQLLAGGVSGMVAWLFSYPMDVIKTRVQSFPLGQPRPMWAARHNWLPDGGFINVAKHIYRTEGVRGFWRGFGPCIVPSFPANALGFVAYEVAIAGFLRMGFTA